MLHVMFAWYHHIYYATLRVTLLLYYTLCVLSAREFLLN